MVKLQITSDKTNAVQILRSAIEAKSKRLQISLNKTQQEIAKFETKYNLSSDKFIDFCTAEDLNEEIDYICWMGELKIQQSLIDELNKMGTLS
jgi:hypothetical protein